MSLIGPVTQDAAIAPRTGSGSAQTQSQQRADAAPAVVSDNQAARADPGVMLKVVPPVQERANSLSVSAREKQIAEGLLGRVLADTPLDEVALREMVFTGKRADDAFLARMAAWLAALPEETQGAIRSAKSPEIARLLKIAALTEPGLKAAPAVILSDSTPLADTINDAMTQLLIVLRQAQPFKLANLLEHLISAQGGYSSQSELPEGGLQKTPQSQSLANGEDGGLSKRQGIATESSEVELSGSKASDQTRDQVRSSVLDIRASAGRFAPLVGHSDLGGSKLHLERSDTHLANHSGISGGTPLIGQGPGALGTVNSVDAFQNAVLDAMKLVMDGRLIWAGQLMPGTHARIERSDAWQANRRAPGGMEKGTSIRIAVELPSLGSVEVRALSFPGQVAVRVVTDASATSTFVEAMPSLQQLLRSKNLNGVNVVIETK